MGKGDKKGLNPADAFRKSIRKQELKKNKKNQEVAREVRDLLSDPQKIQTEIDKLQKVICNKSYGYFFYVRITCFFHWYSGIWWEPFRQDSER